MQKDTTDTIKNQIKRLKKITFTASRRKLIYHFYSTLKEKDAHSMFYKSTTDKKSFFNKESRYVVTRRFKNHRGSECYREQEVDSGKKVEGWFLRKKFFALKNNVQ